MPASAPLRLSSGTWAEQHDGTETVVGVTSWGGSPSSPALHITRQARGATGCPWRSTLGDDYAQDEQDEGERPPSEALPRAGRRDVHQSAYGQKTDQPPRGDMGDVIPQRHKCPTAPRQDDHGGTEPHNGSDAAHESEGASELPGVRPPLRCGSERRTQGEGCLECRHDQEAARQVEGCTGTGGCLGDGAHPASKAPVVVVWDEGVGAPERAMLAVVMAGSLAEAMWCFGRRSPVGGRCSAAPPDYSEAEA